MADKKNRKARAQKRSQHQKATKPASELVSQNDQPGVDGETRSSEGSSLEVRATSFTGPLPDPRTLFEYDQVQDGLAERIVAMAERQSAHRQKLESSVVIGGGHRAWAGLVAGLVVALAFLGVSAWLIDGGNAVAGTILGSVDLIGLVGVFVFQRVEQRSELEDRK